jgi:hypothetical protein
MESARAHTQARMNAISQLARNDRRMQSFPHLYPKVSTIPDCRLDEAVRKKTTIPV